MKWVRIGKSKRCRHRQSWCSIQLLMHDTWRPTPSWSCIPSRLVPPLDQPIFIMLVHVPANEMQCQTGCWPPWSETGHCHSSSWMSRRRVSRFSWFLVQPSHARDLDIVPHYYLGLKTLFMTDDVIFSQPLLIITLIIAPGDESLHTRFPSMCPQVSSTLELMEFLFLWFPCNLCQSRILYDVENSLFD